ncbi:MAG: AarF/UbiB family protein [Myxococcota bacterium]
MLRLLGWGLRTATSEAVGRLLDPFVGHSQRARRRGARLVAASQRLTVHLGALKGVFVKAGQFAAMRPDLLPADARLPLATLQRAVPPLGASVIRRQLEVELGQKLALAFEDFGDEVLGAASLAQVHPATLRDGTRVAVKIQYPGLDTSLHGDLEVARTLIRILAWASGRRIPNQDRLFREFAESLEAELDFRTEAASAREIAANLANDSAVVVPQIFDAFSTRRVLTMERFEVLPLERERLLERGIDPTRVLEIVVGAYAKQLFEDGFFHADPHPGNLFVVDEADAPRTPRVLFLDFGLSKRLQPELRRALRAGLRALLRRDPGALLAEMEALGMLAPGARSGVEAALGALFKEAGAGALGVGKGSAPDLFDRAKQWLQETPGLQLPNDALLFAKTVSTLVALGARLAPETDLLGLLTPHVLRFLVRPEETAPERLSDRRAADPGAE